ncbi:LuxR C-terminal-related transcriptional regulator [Cupriavidus sp. CP313]
MIGSRERHGSSPPVAIKLNPPNALPSQVQRQTICDAACDSHAAKVVLISAPAGFGKTTAMTQIRSRLEGNGVATAWLTCDAADNDTSRFLGNLAVAVSRLAPRQHARDDRDNLEPRQSMTVLETIHELGRSPLPFALFLDELEHLHEPAVLGLLREILSQLPRRGLVVIGTRTTPDLGLARLRMHGELVEIDASWLRFSLEETVDFFNKKRHLSIPYDEVRQLHQTTEGWVAAISLASVALERHVRHSDFITRFSASNREIAEYLSEDVLNRQPAATRNFLLRTSVLKHLSPALCDAILRRTDSTQMLERLERSNLFLTSIAGPEPTYRYHSLFASFLRNQLAHEMPDEAPRLTMAASHWHEEQGRPVPAIDYAIDAQDYGRALDLLATHADSFLSSGRWRLLSRWFGAIPSALLGNYPILRVVHILAVYFTRGAHEANRHLEQPELKEATNPEVVTHLRALRPLLLASVDRHEAAYEVGVTALSSFPTGNSFADGILANAMAVAFAVRGEHEQARKLLDEARITQSDSPNPFGLMYTESVEGMIDMQENRLRQATARFRMAVAATGAPSYCYTTGNAWAGVFYAHALYEANELEQAARLLDVYVPITKELGLPDHMITGHVTLARIAVANGNVPQAFQLLSELEYLGHHRHAARAVASAKLERARLLVMQGNLIAAQAELERANSPDIWKRCQALRLPANDVDYLELGQLRWQIAAGNASEALPDIESAISMATSQRRLRRAMKLCVLKSLALDSMGDMAAANAQMRELLKAACHEGIMRLVLDEGRPARNIVLRLERSSQAEPPTQRDPIFADFLQRLLQGFGPFLDDRATRTPGDSGESTPTLSAAELKVLRLLAEGCSNKAMSEKLFVSDSTVRTHVRNISQKLGTHSRTQAVAKARLLGLIS